MARAEALVVRPLPYLFLIGSIALSACAPTTVDSGASYSLKFRQSGGFAGSDETTSIQSVDASITFSSGQGKLQKATLTGSELDSLDKMLANTDLSGGPYRCDECADEFIYEVTTISNGVSSVVQWDDLADAPDDLDALRKVIEQIDGNHFAEPSP